MMGCLRTRARKQPIIALYFESGPVLKFYNLDARPKSRRLTCQMLILVTDRAGTSGDKLGFIELGLGLGKLSLRCQAQREAVQLVETWPKSRILTCLMPTK